MTTEVNRMDFATLRKASVALRREMVHHKCAEHDDCPICLVSMYGRPVYLTRCGHTWCMSCQRTLRTYTSACCLCRESLRMHTEDDDDRFEELLLRFEDDRRPPTSS